ncbi:COG1470 family protein [Methanococcoides burtonii]|uniref:Uncharacterized protein n=1 Tax=Methanococcoides burtonii (strain DSM 6242 / NBRC 107633 / OCM 468 / ACE-M) TaxID=259564 RepID=Q12YZ8_METBU|nr:hypothetical protein [Methanococcoides burtonii]ABE51328.1 Hypothetical protein Mbur_0332 [Methanococcoides burtonii DSM 6242]
MKVILSLIIMLAMIHPASAIGIGVSPAEIDIYDGLKGYEYTKSLTIFNTGPETTTFSLDASGDIEDWISFYQGDNASIDSVTIEGQSRTNVVIRFILPEDAANGNYSGTVLVQSIPNELDSEDSGSAMAIGASASVNIEVTGEQILGGVVNAIHVDDSEPGYSAQIRTIFKNTGNVVAKPIIKVSILSNGDLISTFVHDESGIAPLASGTILVNWDTTISTIPGDYSAKIDIFLGDELLRSEVIDFKILSVGSLSRQGELTDILIQGEKAPGNLLKVRAYFQNTGDIEADAKFKAEIFRDDVLIDMIESDELTVEKTEKIVLESYFKPVEEGEYLIKGQVIFGGKETPIMDIPLSVEDKAVPGFGVVSLMIAMMVLLLLRRRT